MTDNSSMNESGKSKGMTVLGMAICFLVFLAAGLLAMHALIGQKLPSDIAKAKTHL